MANTTGKKYGGRKKGTPNKTTHDMKSAILEAFDRAGGADYLTMLAKVLPNENVNENRNIDVNAMTERLQEGRDRVAKLRVVNGE